MDESKIWRDSQPRCQKCKHLVAFHADDGCKMQLLGVACVPIYRCACADTPATLNIQHQKYELKPLAKPVAEIAHLPSAFEASKGKYNMSQVSVDARIQIDLVYQKLAILQTTIAKNQGLEEELLIGLKALSTLLSGVIVYRS